MCRVAIVTAFLVIAALATSAEAGIVARIDVSAQTMTVSENGRVKYRWPVSTARKGYRTPRGTFRPTRLHKMWYSQKYDNSPMPHSIFFTGGYAIHGSPSIPPFPASHGCVRLSNAEVVQLYDMVDVGTPIVSLVAGPLKPLYASGPDPTPVADSGPQGGGSGGNGERNRDR
jgi:lipoprotein-anchoring transpeptidase ErfK/SrfK